MKTHTVLYHQLHDNMFGRYREKQYQRAAQKHNEEFLKHDYYQQIANYFERECRIAKHYDSWNYKSSDPKGELEKARRAEKLQARRTKLRNLLKEEEERYRKELEERKSVKSRPEESSLQALKQKLREKRAEQSLYLPRTCRRYQSYFVCPTGSNSPHWNTLRDTNLQYPRVCRDSTNLINQPGQYHHRRGSKMSEESGKSFQELENVKSPQESSYNPSSQYGGDSGRPNSKYSARYARRSLENTNVRSEESDDYPPNRSSSRCSVTFGTHDRYSLPNGEIRGDDKENRTEDARLSPQNGRVAGSRSSSVAEGPPDRPRSRQEDVGRQRDDEVDYPKRSSVNRLSESDSRRSDTSVDKCSAKDDQDTKTKETWQFEVEKSLPWLRMNPGDKNLSKQMFLYLTHKELKCKIEDLAKREMHACNKQYWDEALRLRDMRNRLELLREKELYHTENLDLDEEARQTGMVNIGRREAELSEREQICMDSTMYSEDAKALWKKWVHEDERSAIKDARQLREKLMSSLEKEWQNLAIRDKEKISRSYQSVMNDSALQEEHKLAAAINASRMKSVSSSLK